MNEEIIESLGFTKDLSFQLEEWIKPYLQDPNKLSFIKFKSVSDSFNLYYNSNSNFNIILEKTQHNNVFIFQIKTIDELIVLLNQTGLAIYTNIYTNYLHNSDFLLEHKKILKNVSKEIITINNIPEIINWGNLQYNLDNKTILHYIDLVSWEDDEPETFELSFSFYDCQYKTNIYWKDVLSDFNTIYVWGESILFSSFQDNIEENHWNLISQLIKKLANEQDN